MNKIVVYIVAIVLVVLIVWSWLAYPGWIINKIPGSDWQPRGVYGDSFGALTSLFTGLAFAGVIITILLQMQELKLQRDELKDTRMEFKDQNRTLKLQRFETTFFNIFNLRNDQLKVFGPNVFQGFVLSLSGRLMQVPFKPEDFNNFKRLYHEFYELEPRFVLDTYFVNLTALLQFVDKSTLIKESEKLGYISLVFSLLTIYEKRIIFYHIPLAGRNANSTNELLYDLYRKYKLSDYLDDPWFERTHELLKHFDKDAIGVD